MLWCSRVQVSLLVWILFPLRHPPEKEEITLPWLWTEVKAKAVELWELSHLVRRQGQTKVVAAVRIKLMRLDSVASVCEQLYCDVSFLPCEVHSAGLMNPLMCKCGPDAPKGATDLSDRQILHFRATSNHPVIKNRNCWPLLLAILLCLPQDGGQEEKGVLKPRYSCQCLRGELAFLQQRLEWL